MIEEKEIVIKTPVEEKSIPKDETGIPITEPNPYLPKETPEKI